MYSLLMTIVRLIKDNISEQIMFNLVVNNMIVDEFKSGSEVRKAAQIFNSCEAYVDTIIENAASNTSCQKKIKKFVHNELLKKFREILRKNFKFQEQTWMLQCGNTF